jgi:hypothetical protein
VEYAEIMQDGSKRLPLGDRALGQVVHTADGRMSAQLVRADRTAFASDDYRGAPAEAAAAAFQQYFGYFGSYKIDAGAGKVTHFIGRLVPEPREQGPGADFSPGRKPPHSRGGNSLGRRPQYLETARRPLLVKTPEADVRLRLANGPWAQFRSLAASGAH